MLKYTFSDIKLHGESIGHAFKSLKPLFLPAEGWRIFRNKKKKKNPQNAQKLNNKKNLSTLASTECLIVPEFINLGVVQMLANIVPKFHEFTFDFPAQSAPSY